MTRIFKMKEITRRRERQRDGETERRRDGERDIQGNRKFEV